MTKQAELLCEVNAQLGEGPLWDERNSVLYWVDINGHTLNRFDPETGKNTAYDLGQPVSTVVLRESGGLLVTLRDGFASYDENTDTLAPIIDPESDKPDNRFNDGKCDPAGRFWAGTMHKSATGYTGALYRLDTDLSAHLMVTDVGISNGICWSADNQTMYYIDTPTRQVFAFDYDIETGNIDNRRSIITVPEANGSPDGMAIDSEGMLWVAHWNGWSVNRWNPNTGEHLQTIKVPASQVTACAFVGDQLDTLYITTARTGLSDEQLKEQPHAGSLFVAKVDVTGTTTYRFKG